MHNKNTKRCTIAAAPCYDNSYRWEIRCSDGDVQYVYAGNPGAPRDGTAPGSQGTLTYQSTATRGW